MKKFKITYATIALLILPICCLVAQGIGGGGGGIEPAKGDKHWKAPVANSSILPSTADTGDARMAKDVNTIYTYNGTAWVASSQSPLGFTPENVANKDTNTSLGTSDTKYPSQNAVKTYADTGLSGKENSLGFTPENIANKDTNTSLGTSDTKYPSQNATKSYVDTGLSGKQATLAGSISGTANQTIVSANSNSVPSNITISNPQDINTTSTPTFAGIITPLIKPATDSTTAVQIQNSTGTNILNVDTTNLRVGMGTTTPFQKVEIYGTKNTPQLYLRSDGTADTDYSEIVFGSSTAERYMNAIRSNRLSSLSFFTSSSVSNYANLAEKMTILVDGSVGIGNTAPASVFVVAPPAAETIAADAVITANGCGTMKQLTAALPITTNTTNTFTAPAAANAGCCMDVVHIGTNATNTITLDSNTNFVSAGAANVVLGIGDTCRVCSNGASGKWFQIGDTGNN